jgi:hypothetical protein
MRETLAKVYLSTLSANQENTLVNPNPLEWDNQIIRDYSLLVSTVDQAPIYQSSLRNNGISTQLVVLLLVNGYKVQYSLQKDGNIPLVQAVKI